MYCLADTHAPVRYLFAAPELSATAKNLWMRWRLRADSFLFRRFP